MARFLSAEWFEGFSAALGEVDGDPEWPPLDLGQEIVGAPEGTVLYTVHVRNGIARLELGTLEGAAATLVEDYETAKAIASGASISDLLAKGRITIRGDAGALVAAQAPLAALADALGQVARPTEV